MIVVLGAGAVGCFFGALLVRGGQDVSFFARGAQADALRERGIRIESTSLGTIDVSPVHVATRAEDLPAADLILVCVKAHQTAGILGTLVPLVTSRTSIVTLQNGVESDDEVAARVGDARVFPGVVYVGATIDRPGVVSHVAAGTIAAGMRPGANGDRAALERAIAALAASGRPVRLSEDIRRDRWRKLIWNAGFNTVSAHTGLVPRELLARSETRALVEGIMREVVAVARAQGIELGESDVTDQIEWTERADAIRTSMMVDRQRGRPMEIDALIGVVVRRGRERGVPTPLSERMRGELLNLRIDEFTD